MITVKFGDKDSYKDWGLILKPKSRPLPAPKTNYVNIEGKDGDLDLTTSLTGDVKYQNVSYSLEFTLLDKRADWESKLYEISTYLHGKKLNVIFSDDAEWYCTGRVSLNELTSNKSLGVISLDCNFEPYRLKVSETVINEEIEAGKVITLSNSRKWVMPTLKVWSKNLVNFSTGVAATGTTKTFENNILIVESDGTRPYQSWNINISEIILSNSNRTLYFNFEKIETTSAFDGTVVQLNIAKINGSQEYKVLYDKYGQSHSYEIPKNTDNIKTVYLAVYATNNTNSMANKITITKPMLCFEENCEYKEYVEPHAIVIFEGKEISFSKQLKTPDIILKENESKITLASGEDEIQISYREGKL